MGILFISMPRVTLACLESCYILLDPTNLASVNPESSVHRHIISLLLVITMTVNRLLETSLVIISCEIFCKIQ